MTTLTRTCLMGLTAFAAALSCAAQTGLGDIVWRTYLDAGANAMLDKSWPEAETFFTAAITEAEHGRSSEPFLTISKYSLAAVYVDEGKQDEAQAILKTLTLTLSPAELNPQLRPVVPSLAGLGEIFFDEADAEAKDATAKKIQGDALKKINDEVTLKYRLSRRYYQWAFMLDRHFLPPHSPELQGVALGFGLASFHAGEYPDAVEGLTELLEVVRLSARRQEELSQGSVAFSLASSNVAGPADQGLSPAAIAFYLGLSYEAIAADVPKDKPGDAIEDYTKGERQMEVYAWDQYWGKNNRTVLARVYHEHAQLLQQSGQKAQAAAFELKAKKLQPTIK
jgi:tetratricopeptide (TPR) repeat protein